MRDNSMEWMRKRLFLTPDMMQGTDVALGTACETAGITPVELTNIGMCSWIFADGELMNGYFPCPADLNPEFPVGFSIFYTLDHDGTGAGSALWIILQGTEVIGGAISIPTAALDVPIVDHAYKDTAGTASTTDWLLQKTSRGIRKKIGLSRNQIEAGAFITVKIEMDQATNETAVHYIGLEMDYAPMRTLGYGRPVDSPLQCDGRA